MESEKLIDLFDHLGSFYEKDSISSYIKNARLDYDKFQKEAGQSIHKFRGNYKRNEDVLRHLKMTCNELQLSYFKLEKEEKDLMVKVNEKRWQEKRITETCQSLELEIREKTAELQAHKNIMSPHSSDLQQLQHLRKLVNGWKWLVQIKWVRIEDDFLIGIIFNPNTSFLEMFRFQKGNKTAVKELWDRIRLAVGLRLTIK